MFKTRSSNGSCSRIRATLADLRQAIDHTLDHLGRDFIRSDLCGPGAGTRRGHGRDYTGCPDGAPEFIKVTDAEIILGSSERHIRAMRVKTGRMRAVLIVCGLSGQNRSVRDA
jgi:hypothetical protein